MPLFDTLRDRRNRLFANPDFQDFAARFWLTRWVARARARKLFDLTAGFVYSQILGASVSTGLLEALEAGPKSPTSLVEITGLPRDGCERLCRAAASLGLLEARGGGHWALGPEGAALLGNRGIFPMIRHHALLYRDLADPVALLKARSDDTALAKFWSYGDRSAPDAHYTHLYSDLMGSSQALVSEQVIPSYDFGRHSTMVDIGGGLGAFAKAVARSAPALIITIADLPDVVPLARTSIAEAGLEDRLVARACNFKTDPLPEGADLITLVRVLHDHDDGVVRALLAKIAGALPTGGRVMIAEPLAETRSARAMGDGYFGLYLWAMGSGRPRPLRTYRTYLAEAGFRHVHEHSTAQPLIARVLVAQK